MRIISETKKLTMQTIKSQNLPGSNIKRLCDKIESLYRELSLNSNENHTKQIVILCIKPFIEEILKIVKNQDLRIQELEDEVKELQQQNGI